MSEKESICEACGEPIDDGIPYASIGGNIVPYLPAYLYHMQCVPTTKSWPPTRWPEGAEL